MWVWVVGVVVIQKADRRGAVVLQTHIHSAIQSSSWHGGKCTWHWALLLLLITSPFLSRFAKSPGLQVDSNKQLAPGRQSPASRAACIARIRSCICISLYSFSSFRRDGDDFCFASLEWLMCSEIRWL